MVHSVTQRIAAGRNRGQNNPCNRQPLPEQRLRTRAAIDADLLLTNISTSEIGTWMGSD